MKNDILDLEAFRAWLPDFRDAEFILEDGKYVCGWAVEKMSKSMYNVVNPDYIVDNYGADTLRMYEMFLGPLEQSKPWDTNGIDGVHKFLRRFWRLFSDKRRQLRRADEGPTEGRDEVAAQDHQEGARGYRELLVQHLGGCLHDLPQRTGRAATSGPCSNRSRCSSPPSPPHRRGALGAAGPLGKRLRRPYPQFDEKYLTESSFEYPVSVNGKLRFKREYPLSAAPAEIQADVVATEEAQKWLDGKAPRR